MKHHVELDAYLRDFNVLIGSMVPRKKRKMKMESLLVTYLRIPTYLTYSIELRESSK